MVRIFKRIFLNKIKKGGKYILYTKNNMKRYVGIIVIIAILAILIVSTIVRRNFNNNIQINVEELAERIAKSSSFEDKLEKIDNELVINMYGFPSDSIEEIVSYQGSGASSEEILILKVKNINDVNNEKEIIETRLKEKKDAYASYMPKEVSKIDKRILIEKGNYIILCICNDYDTVNKIIDEYLR